MRGLDPFARIRPASDCADGSQLDLTTVFRGLFNPRRGLSDHDYLVVGTMVVMLLIRSNQWVHRRVETLAFVDEDAARRFISVDFTLPHWVHKMRKTPVDEVRRQLVPLGLLRKGTLVNFDLRDENDAALPLLTTGQNRQVAEASLVALANATLGINVINEAPAIQCDIRHLVEAPGRSEGEGALMTLYGKRDRYEMHRLRLRESAIFRSVASPLATNFMALTMTDIGWHQRRVLNFAYDESLYRNSNDRLRFFRIAMGKPRVVWMNIPRVGDTESQHFEVEAPDGMQLNTHQGIITGQPLADVPTLRPIAKQGTFQRSHVHFTGADPGDEALVRVELRPRESTLVRGACLAGFLSMAMIGFILARLGQIVDESSSETAATLLLATPGLAVTLLTRIDDNKMTTKMLWPLRVIALVPGLAAIVAACAVLGGGNDPATRWVIAGAIVLAAVGTAPLLVCWLGTRSQDADGAGSD